MLKNNPVMKKLVETGEERIGKIAQQLLSNEKFVATIQTLVSRTLSAKGTLDKSLRSALSAMNLPPPGTSRSCARRSTSSSALLGSVETQGRRSWSSSAAK